MSKATDHDAEMVQAQEDEIRRKANDSKTHHHQSNNNRREEGSTLEERKREFVKKTVPAAAAGGGEGSATKNKKSRTLLAVAAAKREMERERKRLRRAQEEEEERQQGGMSILTWIAYGLIGVAGIASLVLGINRIKKIMQSNDDVGKVAAASTHVVAYAVEEFLDELVRGAVAVSVEHGNGKILSPSHIKAHVGREATLDFCQDIVAKAPDVGDDAATGKKKSRRRGDAEDNNGTTTQKKKKTTRAKKKKKKTSVESDADDMEEEDNNDDDEFGLIAECLDVKDDMHTEQDDDNGLEHAEDEDYDEF
ncbi:Dr1-associated corepressor [Picochlorum sp. SENEW3]|nr:Dr1-associated corepressor [Picochlorum sp. SENEW3]WPT17358.1 Dr1-associated corepressor [Picochlorum sp. SENEW3]